MCERFVHYKLGHDKLDAEHAKLMDLMALAKEASKAVNLELLTKTLLEIQVDLEFHFVHEEMLMEEIGFPYMEYHVHVHNEIKKALAISLSKYKEDRYNAHDNFAACLEENIVHHIDSLDRQITDYINKLQTGDQGLSGYLPLINI